MLVISSVLACLHYKSKSKGQTGGQGGNLQQSPVQAGADQQPNQGRNVCNDDADGNIYVDPCTIDNVAVINQKNTNKSPKGFEFQNPTIGSRCNNQTLKNQTHAAAGTVHAKNAHQNSAEPNLLNSKQKIVTDEHYEDMNEFLNN